MAQGMGDSRRLQIERHFAQLHRFVALFHAIEPVPPHLAKVFRPNRAKSERSIRQNAIETAARDLIGPSKAGSR